MLVPIVCFACGSPIGDVEDLFRHMRAELVKATLQERGTHIAFAAADAGLEVDCSDILDALGIVGDCCRGNLVTAMVFTDYY